MAENIGRYNVILNYEVEKETLKQGSDSVKREVSSMEKSFDSAKKSFAGIVVDKSLEKVKAEIDKVSKSTNNATQSNVNLKAQIKEVATEILKSKNASVELDKIFQKISKTGLNATTKDLEEIEKGMFEILQEAKLTDQQFKILIQNAKEIGQELVILKNSDALQETANEAQKLVTKFTSAKSELRQLTNLINSGQLQGEELVTATKRAAELTDTIGDNREQIKNLASDTRGIDTLIEGTRALAAGFQIVAGAQAVFGDESEEINKALLKLNGIMAIANGLQEAHELLMQNSNISMRIAAAGQKVYTLAVGTSSGALKVFRLALAATGIGLAVIAVGYLVANFDKLKATVLKAVPGLEKIGSVFAGIKNAISGIFKGDLNLAENFKKGFQNNELEKEAEKVAKGIEANISKLQKKSQLLQAQGKSTFENDKKIILEEIRLLKTRQATKEEIAEKEFELELLLAGNRKKAATADKEAVQTEIQKLNAQKSEIEDLIKNGYIKGIKPDDETVQKLNDINQKLEKMNLEFDNLLNRKITVNPIKGLTNQFSDEIDKLTSTPKKTTIIDEIKNGLKNTLDLSQFDENIIDQALNFKGGLSDKQKREIADGMQFSLNEANAIARGKFKTGEGGENGETDEPFFKKLFGFDDAQFAQFTNALKTAEEATKETLRNIFAQEQAINEQRIQAQDERVQAALKMAEKGKVDQLRIEEERLSELKKKQQSFANAQRAIASFQIATSSAVAVAEGIKAVSSAFASGGPGAIPLGIATSLALVAQVAGIVASIRGAFSGLQLKDGIEQVKGPGTRRSDSIPSMLSKDERVVDAETNSKIGFGFKNKDLPKAVDFYKQHKDSALLFANKPFYPSFQRVEFAQNKSNDKAISKRLEAIENTLKGMIVNVNIDSEGLAVEVMKKFEYYETRKRYTS